MYAIHFANATFAVANLAHASNFPSVETARNKGRSGRKRVRGNHLTPVEAAFPRCHAPGCCDDLPITAQRGGETMSDYDVAIVGYGPTGIRTEFRSAHHIASSGNSDRDNCDMFG